MANYNDTSVSTTLTTTVTSGATSWTVGAASTFPAVPFYLSIDPGTTSVEVVLVTNVASNVLTVTRGQSTTVASAHTAGAVVQHVAPASVFSGLFAPQGILRSGSVVSNGDLLYARDTAVTLGTGTGQFMFFTSPISFTTTKVNMILTTAAGSQAAGSGAALYTVDASDNGTLVTTAPMLFTGATGLTSATWGASQAITAGTRYAIGLLFIQGSGNPNLAGYTPSGAVTAGVQSTLPRLTAAKTSLAALATFTAASLVTNQNFPYVELG